VTDAGRERVVFDGSNEDSKRETSDVTPRALTKRTNIFSRDDARTTYGDGAAMRSKKANETETSDL
jgi:hypothetical protein